MSSKKPEFILVRSIKIQDARMEVFKPIQNRFFAKQLRSLCVMRYETARIELWIVAPLIMVV